MEHCQTTLVMSHGPRGKCYALGEWACSPAADPSASNSDDPSAGKAGNVVFTIPHSSAGYSYKANREAGMPAHAGAHEGWHPERRALIYPGRTPSRVSRGRDRPCADLTGIGLITGSVAGDRNPHKERPALMQ